MFEDRTRIECEKDSKLDDIHKQKTAQSLFAHTTRIPEQLRDGIVKWISAGYDLEVREDLQMHYDRRHKETCGWVFENEDFQRWRDNPSKNILWYSAPPGSGKTVLSSAAIKHLVNRGHPTAYFFYSFSDLTRRRPWLWPFSCFISSDLSFRTEWSRRTKMKWCGTQDTCVCLQS